MLVADDVAVNIIVAGEILKRAGAETVGVENGREAVEAFARQGFDAVLMDAQMPVMDGFEATRRIRKLPGGDAIPIVALTARTVPEDRQLSSDSGMDGYILKPVDARLLVDTLSELLLRYGRIRDSTGKNTREKTSAPDQVSAQGLSPGTAGGAVLEEARAKTLGMPQLPGVNVAEALDRIGGDRELLLSLLRQFLRSFRDHPAAIARSIEAGDLDEARRMAHALAGTSGNLSAKELRLAAKAVEASLTAGNALLALSQVADLAARLELVLRGVEDLEASRTRTPRIVPSGPSGDASRTCCCDGSASPASDATT